MDVTIHTINEVSPSLLSKASHALGLEDIVPINDKVYPLSTWEQVIEAIGQAANCPVTIIERAKSRYTYYMLYHYAPTV